MFFLKSSYETSAMVYHDKKRDFLIISYAKQFQANEFIET